MRLLLQWHKALSGVSRGGKQVSLSEQGRAEFLRSGVSRGGPLAVVFCVLFASCASAPKDGSYAGKAFDKAYAAGKYGDCAKMCLAQDGERIDYVLDAAMLHHEAGNWDASRKCLEKAETRIDEAFTKSITRGVASTLFNDNIKEYPGNIYEYLMVNVFNALNYYNKGDLEGAMVEVRKLEVKNKEYVNKYGEVALTDDDENDDGLTGSALSRAGVSMSDILARSPKKPTEEDVYKDSALVRYLSMVLRTMYGDNTGNNELDGRFLTALNGDFAETVQDELNIPDGSGRVDVLAMTGKIASREAAYTEFPLGLLSILAPNLLSCVGDPALFNLTFGYPRYVPEEEDVVPEQVEIAGENTSVLFEMRKLESFDEAVRKDVAVKARRAYIRSIYRSTAKKVTTIASSEAGLVAANQEGGYTALAAQLTAATAIRVALAALDKSEVPDTRQCAYLPKSAWAGGLDVPPGTYTIKVKYNNGIIKESHDVIVRRGKTTLVEEVCVK